MAFVLCNHEKGLIFKALEECLTSTSMEIAKSSFIVATWLIHMLYNFPDTGIRDVARKSLLEQFIQMLQSTKNLEEKILAALALRGFITDLGKAGSATLQVRKQVIKILLITVGWSL